MLKKAISIFILFVFLFSTIGVIASSYRCKMAMPAGKSCCKPGDRDCCEKNSKLLKISDDFLSVPSQFTVKPASDGIVAMLTPLYDLHLFSTAANFVPLNHGPPSVSVDLLLLTRSFRI